MDFTGAGALAVRYLQGPMGVLSRQTAAGAVAWYLAGQLGTVGDLIDNSGNIIDHVDFSAFGVVLGETNPSVGDRIMGFAGLERDAVSRLNLAVERAQNPGTGRWTTQDPLSFAAGDANLYGYVGNAPATSSDPIGLAPTEGIPVPGGTLHIDGESMGTATPHVQYGPGGKGKKIRIPADMTDVTNSGTHGGNAASRASS